MKKLFVAGVAAAVLLASACSRPAGEKPAAQTTAAASEASAVASEASAAAAETNMAAAAETSTEATTTDTSAAAAAATDAASASAEDSVLVKINTDGPGYIAFSEDGTKPEFDEEFPATSAFTHVKKGSVIGLSTRGEEGYQFVKWIRNGAYFSEETEITAPVEEDTEFIAVFGVSSGFEGPAVENIGDAKTMADVLALPGYESATTDDCYVYVFEQKGIMYRAVCDIDSGVQDRIFELDFEDPEYTKKYNAIIAPLEIARMDNLTEMIPGQEELDAWIGKTLGDLLDKGWSYSGYNLEDKEFNMNYGLFSYVVGYEGEPAGGPEELEEGMIRPLVVTSVTYDRLGNGTADLDDGRMGRAPLSAE